MRQALLFCIALIVYSQGLAQSNGNNTQDSIKTITLPSVLFVQPLLDLTQQSLHGKRLQNGTQTNLSATLDHIPGVFKIHETGFPLVYRGQSGNRLRIERNGALRTGVVQQGYLSDDVNPGTIGRIRVVKGIESTLFGSGAIGGVIQIDDRDFGSLSNLKSVYLAHSGNNSSRTAGLSVTRKNERSGIRLDGRINRTDDFAYGGGEIATNSAQRQDNLSLALFRNSKNNRHQLTWRHSYSTSDIERPQGFQNNPFELRNYRNHYTYQTSLASQLILKTGAVLKQNLWAFWLDTDQDLRSFNGDFSRINVTENRSYQKQGFGYRGTIALQPVKDLTLQVGADFTGSWLDQQNIRQDFINQIFDENAFTQSRTERMAGLFGLGEYKLNDRAILGVALRADIATIGTALQSENHKALTGGLELTLGKKGLPKNVFSLSRKFRYPSQLESVGVLFGGRGTFFGNPDIQPEYSYQLEWSHIRKITGFMDVALSSWLALFDNRIAETFLGNNEFTYRNLNQARTMGLEARIDYHIPGSTIRRGTILSLTGSYTQGDDLENEGLFGTGTPLIGIPPVRLRLSSIHKTTALHNLSLQANLNIDYVLAYDRLPSVTIRQTFGVMETDAYWLANAGASIDWELNENHLRLGFDLTSLTDTSYFPFGARIRGMGRNLSAYLRFSF